MFALTPTPINTQALQQSLEDHGAGALVCFEGRVRRVNDGKPVDRLHYEAYAPLAEREGQLILEEALGKFEIIATICQHRIGTLELGEAAIWIGVTSQHRRAAYEASQYIIDEIKKRVPIWKKEEYSDGEAVWVNATTGEPR